MMRHWALCYDRIIPALASLIGRKKGLHHDTMCVHASTLKEAKFKLKMVLGMSGNYYQHCQHTNPKHVEQHSSPWINKQASASAWLRDAQLWSNLLWVSGGLLELEKCSYH
eukprot:5212005-Ditylum_brightwellii.AAC.1